MGPCELAKATLVDHFAVPWDLRGVVWLGVLVFCIGLPREHDEAFLFATRQ